VINKQDSSRPIWTDEPTATQIARAREKRRKRFKEKLGNGTIKRESLSLRAQDKVEGTAEGKERCTEYCRTSRLLGYKDKSNV
jgi:hypothetical protein